MSTTQSHWQVFRGDHKPDHMRIEKLPPAPPWRQFQAPNADASHYEEQIKRYWDEVQALARDDSASRDRLRGKNFRVRSDQTKIIGSPKRVRIILP
ncbi:MAG: hypothetical protein AAF327_21890 [Cyanobacteria bacterium P01_A01_bin.37]